jgi:Ca-activated chloride channel family protein
MNDWARKLRVIGIAAALGCGSGGGYDGTSIASGGYAHGGENATAAPTPAEHQAGERYGGARENGFVEAAQDALATFSLDVDTASYTIMRRDVSRGALPAPESVRVEEYINFFDFDDAPPEPSDDTPFAVHLEAAPSPFGRGMHLLRVGVRGEDIDQEQRPPANVVFLVDVSGSMQSAEKLGLVKQSLGILLDSLRPDDTIGLVVYAGTDAVLLPPTAVAERGRILDAILGLTAGGSTNGAAGVRTAYDLASQHFRRGGINRVILCTDGDFNVGVTGVSASVASP